MRSGNTLADMTEYLFAQLDALSNEDLSDEELGTEIKRSKAITDVADRIIATHETVIKAVRLKDDIGLETNRNDVKMLEMNREE